MKKPPITPPETTQVPAVLAAQAHAQCGSDPSEIGEAFRRAFGKIDQLVQQTGAEVAGPPRAVYTAYGPEGTEFTVAIPVTGVAATEEAMEEAFVRELPGGTALRFVHKGAYERLAETYGGIAEWMISDGRMEDEADWESVGTLWEEYLNDPGTTPADDLLTYIYLPTA